MNKASSHSLLLLQDTKLDESAQIQQESLANAKVSVRLPCWLKTDFDMK